MSILIFKIFKSQNKTTYNTFQEVSKSLDNLLHKSLVVSTELDKNHLNAVSREIVATYRKNKIKIHHIVFHLGNSYILPYDREDIFEMITGINDISKLLVSYAKKSNYYRRNFEKDFHISNLVEVLISALNEVSGSLLKLQKFKQNSKIFIATIEKIKDANRDFAFIFENVSHELFEEEFNSRALIMKQDLLDILEQLNLKTSNHVHTLEAIMVKYS
jgi:uncharacterized protein Yka (UPF0111/DUF47 family)